MITILQIVPLLPSLFAELTIYTPEATRLPLRSLPSQENEPPVLRP